MSHASPSLAAGHRRRRSVLGVAAAVVASLTIATLVVASQPGPGYLAVNSWSAETVGTNLVRLSATTNGTIPKQADGFIHDNVIVGIAWADLDTGTALVATIHPTLGRDSKQRPDVWHLHTAQLAGGATAPNDFCLVAVSTTPTAGIQIAGTTMKINLSAWKMPDPGSGPIPASAIDAAVGFTVHPGDAGCVTGLGVRVSA
jgi:hypothetical protein